uniref:Polynucleotidyl transferase ribonuclease H-like superfamily protein n=1 Tax=Melianthus villosus TaxID=377280 RepID=A0A0G4AM57_9ROSI|nr:polynucleotidyl transferase ribonuclease H-like superfamily protein [Melianthus villosus]
MAFSIISLFRTYPFSSGSLSPLNLLSMPPVRTFRISSSLSTSQHDHHPKQQQDQHPSFRDTSTRWKPMCLYHTHGKCNMMDDQVHLERFNHNFSEQLRLNLMEFKNLRSQQFDFFLVLDLEGKIEILEFPVVLVDAKTMDVVDLFHRFVRPSQMSEQRINEYIEGKYGKLGVDRVWHDTAIPFMEVAQQFESWLIHHRLWRKELGGPLDKAAFVTCGNWDVKTKVPQQCQVAKMKLPKYFMEWINLKDVYLNFYKRRATGMMTMMKELQIPLLGSHHLGVDDAKNITRVLQRMLADGALMQITARRECNSTGKVEFLFKNRIR